MANPSFFLFPRIALKDHNIGDIKIKKGTYLNVNLGANGIRGDVFPDPMKFDPDRYLNMKPN